MILCVQDVREASKWASGVWGAAGELLFSAAHHDLLGQRGLPGALKKPGLNRRISHFIHGANREAHTHGLPEQVIPDDPSGSVAMARFRRTLAWHIARRPGGLVALAIQYGHMRTTLDARTSSGYASRSRGGIHSIVGGWPGGVRICREACT
jgi:hypothetical protein